MCSQVSCRPYLAANFGFFELRTFPWSPNKVEVGTFYPFTLKVGSKYTYIILEALVRNQQICIPLQYRMRFPIHSYLQLHVQIICLCVSWRKLKNVTLSLATHTNRDSARIRPGQYAIAKRSWTTLSTSRAKQFIIMGNITLEIWALKVQSLVRLPRPCIWPTR